MLNIRKNLALIIGLALPVLMILVVAASIYIPRALVHPKTNFVYGVDTYVAPKSFTDSNNLTAVYYLYDVTASQSRLISEKDYQAMKLNADATSPDGFKVEAGNGGGLLFFGGGTNDYGQHYLTGHGASFKINVDYSTTDYNNQFKFLGWVK